MPLVRVEVRNEYGLGMPELYNKETAGEDPKAVLDGVTVAGLVGILRQLGDLAEFAAEVFHGLQEQVLITSSRSHKLIVRLHNIEAALPSLEMAILAQRSHLHFAYTAGSHWHPRLKHEQNHFIYSDLPRCIMNSYEECRDPPRLHLLDKFDAGGSGSCPKRYSDPTFFKRSSAASGEIHLQNVPREKKARKKKKNRALRKKEVTYGAALSTHDDRMHFSSSNFNGKTSPSQDPSKFDGAFRSEMENHLTSFDSKTGSSYIECVFRPSYSTQSEENEPKELSSDIKMHHNDSLDSASLDEQSEVVGDNIRNSLEQKQIGPSSSYVTWDEKTEIMEPAGWDDGATEILCTHVNQDTHEGAVNFRTVDQMDFDFNDDHMPTSVSGGDQPDDIESETEYYVDALNTIESESETDLDFQTKRELQQFSSVNGKGAEEGRLTGHQKDDHPVNFESTVPACTSPDKAISGTSPKSVSPEFPVAVYSSSNNGMSEDKTYSVLSESNARVQSPQMAGISSTPCTSPVISESCDMLDGITVETLASNETPLVSIESNSQATLSEKIVRSCESPKPPAAAGAPPIMFWTNGGLLGLEPSKPPDFSVPSTVGQDSVAESKNDVLQSSSQSSILADDAHFLTPDIVVNSSKFEKSSDFHSSISFSQAHEHDSNASSTMTPGTDGPVNQGEPTKVNKENDIISSRILEFSNRLLVNGFRRQVSLVGDEKLASSVRSDVSEKTSMHKAYKTFMGNSFREQSGSRSPVMSPSSSPPLEHMKISFQPIDGFETSKLKLKFPDGNSCHGSSGDLFPSFQLVPEPAISLHDSGSDSDDDTFCRSSPYMLDDYRSNPSESNSEQWQSDESPRSKEHELDDAFGRISSAESVSSSLVSGRIFEGSFHDNCGLRSPFNEDGAEPSKSGRSLDLPNFDSLNASFNQVIGNSDGKYFLELHLPKEPTPSPPPLPPLQWRGVKPHPDVTIEKEDAPPESLTYALDPNLSAPKISLQPKPAPLKQDHDAGTTNLPPSSKQPDWQKLNGLKEASRTTSGKMMDEKEDFLQQIRTKSFNLRRIATERPTFTPGGPNNVKVTAILEKANAIRQAVGSDDGEDDDAWSDT